jgi:hypothetical protein
VLRHPIKPRFGWFVHLYGELFTVDGSVPDRGTQVGGRGEAGVRIEGRAGAMEFFAGGERRIDAEPVTFQAHSWGLAGFRLVTR